MLISNFCYLFNCDMPEKIRDICQKAEAEYFYGNNDLCAILCRQAAEFITKWIFTEEVFFFTPVWYTEYSKFDDLLNSAEFMKALGDTFLLKDVNELKRIGNTTIHDMDGIITIEEAYQCLQTLFRFITRLHNKIYEIPYSEKFFEPYFENNDDVPLVRDYDSLINEESDPEVKAKLALLKKCEDNSFELAPFVEALRGKSDVRRLITALTEPKELRTVLMESSIQLRRMISNCYREFDYREEYAVIAYGIKACRRLVRGTYKYIEQFIDECKAG